MIGGTWERPLPCSGRRQADDDDDDDDDDMQWFLQNSRRYSVANS